MDYFQTDADSKTGERDIYIYREGFYRGVCVSFILVTAALLALELRLFCVDGHKITLAYWDFGQRELVFFILLSAACVFLAYQRFTRFGVYRVTHSVLGYLTLKDKPPDEKKSEEKKE